MNQSKWNKMRKSCRVKHKYATREEAEAKRDETNTVAPGLLRLNVYVCHYCQGFHLTSSKWRKKQRSKHKMIRKQAPQLWWIKGFV